MKISTLGTLGQISSAALLLVACGTSIPAAATRIVAVDGVGLGRAPVCFAPAPPPRSLAERAQQARVEQVCDQAARAQHVTVVPYGSGRCLVASMIWETRQTAGWEAECTGVPYGATCHGTPVYLKTLRLLLAPALGAQNVAETTVAIRSTYDGFSAQSLQALCSGAFEDYPKPLTNAQFDVSVDGN